MTATVLLYGFLLSVAAGSPQDNQQEHYLNQEPSSSAHSVAPLVEGDDEKLSQSLFVAQLSVDFEKERLKHVWNLHLHPEESALHLVLVDELKGASYSQTQIELVDHGVFEKRKKIHALLLSDFLLVSAQEQM